MTTRLADELEQAADDAVTIERLCVSPEAKAPYAARAARLRARAARVRELVPMLSDKLAESNVPGVGLWLETLRLLTGPDLGPTRRDGGT